MIRYYMSRLVLLSWSVVSVVLVVELGLHLGGDRFAVSYFPIYDEYTGWKGAPGEKAWSWEGHNYVLLSNQGLHDHEHNQTKERSTLRIAVLGDSMTEGAQVPVDHTFSAVMQRELTTCPAVVDRTVEVINFGADAYSTAQELLTLRHRVWEYSPDIVLLAFFQGNDVQENSPVLDWNRVTFSMRPYFIHKNGKLALEYFGSVRHPSLAKLYSWVRRHSRVLEMVRRAYFSLMHSSHKVSLSPDTALPAKTYAIPDDPASKEAWDITEELIMSMRDEVVAKGSLFVLVTLSTAIQVYPDSAVRKQFSDRLGVDDLFYPDLRVRALAEHEGIPVLTLAPVLQRYADEHKTFLHGFAVNHSLGEGHWNEEGHRLAGQLIAQQLCKWELAHRGAAGHRG